jgi:hypothetical protein
MVARSRYVTTAEQVLSTDGQAVMNTTLREEYRRAHQILEEVLAGQRSIRVEAAEATLEAGVRGVAVPGRPDLRELVVTDLTPAERARFQRGYEQLFAHAEQYYQRRPGTPAGSPAVASRTEHTRNATDHALPPTGTSGLEGSRRDVEAGARAYDAAGHTVTSSAGSNDGLVSEIRSDDGQFTTTLRERSAASRAPVATTERIKP